MFVSTKQRADLILWFLASEVRVQKYGKFEKYRIVIWGAINGCN